MHIQMDDAYIMHI